MTVTAAAADRPAGLTSIEDMCRMRPEVPEIMSEIFNAYEFEFGNEQMLPAEVFARDSFLPVLSHLACMRISDLFDLPFQIGQSESERAILGIEVQPSFRSLASMVIYMVNLVQVSHDIFGVMPGRINLDDLYEWSLDENMQQKGLPYLGLKHAAA